MTIWYRQGTVAVENGSTAVVGTGTGWLNQVEPGDGISVDGGATWYEVASVESNTGLTLATAYGGSTDSGLAYAKDYRSPRWSLASNLATRVAALLAASTDVLSGEGTPSDSVGGDGSLYLDTASLRIYGPKAAGAWGDGVAIEGFNPRGVYDSEADYFRRDVVIDGSALWMLTAASSTGHAPPTYPTESNSYWALFMPPGPDGPTGPSYAATSSTSLAVGGGAKDLVTQIGLAYIAGTRVRLSSAADPTVTYLDGVVTAYDDSTGDMTVLVDFANGAGTYADWNISVGGQRGAQGIQGVTGASYAGTSTTSLAIGTGSKSLTTQAGLAYVVGSRIRIASAAGPSNYMEGIVTSYTSTTLQFISDNVGGSGTHADWNLSIGGDQGSSDADEEINALFLDNRLTNLTLSEALGAAIFSGPDGSAIHDCFDTLDYVDDEGATGLDTSETGALKPSGGSSTTQTINSATGTTDWHSLSPNSIVDRTTALTAADVINKIGLYSTQAITGAKLKVVQRTASNTYTIVADTGAFNHPGTGWFDVSLSSDYTIPGSGAFYVMAYHPLGAPATAANIVASVSRAVYSGDATGSGVTITEGTGSAVPMRVIKNTVTGDCEVTSTAISAAEQPETMRAVMELYDPDGVTLNTDTVFSVSRDGGTTWSDATLVEKFTRPGDIRVLDTGNVDVSGQPAGTDMLWKWFVDETVTSVKLLGVALWGTA